MANPVLFIRRDVLGLTQRQLAEVLNVEQASVSRWETRARFPSKRLPQIRDLGRRATKAWSDSWLFDPPEAA